MEDVLEVYKLPYDIQRPAICMDEMARHGSWLNMAEIELSALVRQCLERRIPDTQTLTQEVRSWQQQRNDEAVKVQWQFKITDARTKLKHLYPKIQM